MLFCSICLYSEDDVRNVNRSKLIQDVASVCITNNIDSISCRTMRDAAKEFDIPELYDYLVMRCNRQEDSSNKKVRIVAAKLVEKAECEFGKLSLEAIKCRRAELLAAFNFDNDTSMRIAKYNLQMADSLFRKNKNDWKLKELCFLCCIEKIALENITDAESPLRENETYQLELKVDSLYALHNIDTEERVDIYNYIALLKPTFSDFPNFLSYVYDQLPKKPIRQSYIFHNGVYSNASEYYEEVCNITLRLFGENDSRTLDAKKKLVEFKCYNDLGTYDENRKELLELCEKYSAILPQGDIGVYDVKRILWELDSRASLHLEELAEYSDYLLKVKKFYGEYSEYYLNCLYGVISQQIGKDIVLANQLFVEMQNVANVVYKTDLTNLANIKILSYRIAVALNNEQMATECLHIAQDSFNAVLESIKNTSSSPTWLMVLVANNLKSIYVEQVDLEGQCEVSENLLYLLKSLGKKQPMVYAENLLEYSSILVNLQKFNDALRICNEVKEIFEKNKMSTSRLYNELLIIYNGKNDDENYFNTLDEAVKNSVDESDWNCYYKLIQADVKRTVFGDTKSYEKLMTEAYSQFQGLEDGIMGMFFDDYFFVNNYLQLQGKYQESEQLLLRGLERFNVVDGQYNDLYMKFLTEIVGLYTTQFNDYNKAEEFIERHYDNVVMNPANINYGMKLDFLWLKYRLQRAKSDDFVKDMALLKLMQEQVMAFYNSIESENVKERVLIINVLPVLNEIVVLCAPVYEKQLKEIASMKKDSYLNQYVDIATEKMKEFFTNMSSLMEVMDEIDSTFKSVEPDYLETVRYESFMEALSSLFLYVKKDSQKAESVLQKCLKSNNDDVLYRANRALASFNLERGNYSKAIFYYRQVETLAQRKSYAMPDDVSKAEFYSIFSMALYSGKQYDDAITYALKAYELQKKTIDSNINYMTSSERESFLSSKGGMGNKMLKFLLPIQPDRLSTVVYNSILVEKGYLLRASEKIRRSIAQNENSEFQRKIDLLATLKSEQNRLSETMLDKKTFQTTVNEDVSKKQREIDILEHEINRKIKADGLVNDDVVLWEDVKRILDDSDVAVEYVMSDSTIGALVIKKNLPVPKYVELFDYHRLNQIDKWMAENMESSAQQKAEAIYQTDVLNLYSLIWKPLENLMEGAKNIYFSPSGLLNMFSLGAIRRPDGKCMLDYYNMYQLTSTAQLVSLRKKKWHGFKDIILFGAANYSEEENKNSQSLDNSSENLQKQRGAVNETFAFLPFTYQEVEDISKIFTKKGIKSVVKIGGNASENELRKLDGNSPGILHLATHGFFVDTEKKVEENIFLSQFPSVKFSSMMRAGMAFSGANSTWLEGAKNTERDGILTAEEMSAMNFDNTELAVLSACETGVGFHSDEGVFGMYRGFKQAGVKSILASLWSVNDASTSKFMNLFYSKLLEGVSLIQAYKFAINETRMQYHSAYYWAPFILLDAVDNFDK